jgi:hypothetical protein
LDHPENGIFDGDHCVASSHSFEVALFAPFWYSISDFSMMFLIKGLPSHCKPTGLARLASVSRETLGGASRVLAALGHCPDVSYRAVKRRQTALVQGHLLLMAPSDNDLMNSIVVFNCSSDSVGVKHTSSTSD